MFAIYQYIEIIAQEQLYRYFNKSFQKSIIKICHHLKILENKSLSNYIKEYLHNYLQILEILPVCMLPQYK